MGLVAIGLKEGLIVCLNAGPSAQNLKDSAQTAIIRSLTICSLLLRGDDLEYYSRLGWSDYPLLNAIDMAKFIHVDTRFD